MHTHVHTRVCTHMYTHTCMCVDVLGESKIKGKKRKPKQENQQILFVSESWEGMENGPSSCEQRDPNLEKGFVCRW